ncbi:MAG: folate-binding protein YgfZ [Betaproteobacteria bacterium]|nr:folate-binding protein YgfZ [Betaproteobacteria bacterium]
MTAWTDFLASRGARFEHGGVADFGDPKAELAAAASADVLTDLSHFGLIGFSGEDAETFLHGQITNDLRALTDGKAIFAGYLSAKGRMLANFLVMRRAGELLVMLPESLREGIQKRLSMFVLRSQVKARDAGGEWVRLGVNGPAAAARVAEVLGRDAPVGIMSMAQSAAAFALCLGDARYDLFVAPDRAAAVWEQLATRARPVGAPVWDWLMVRAGVPVVLPPTQDHFVPQMANMEILGGISFNKGCYPGQEIVARSQYLGKVKRRLYLAHVDAEARPGDELFAPEPADQAAGLIANAAPAPGGGWDVLAVALSPSVEAGDIRLKSRDGARLSFAPLPYPVA